MTIEHEPARLFTVAEVAWLLDVTTETVRNLDRRGELHALRTPTGHRRVRADEVDR